MKYFFFTEHDMQLVLARTKTEIRFPMSNQPQRGSVIQEGDNYRVLAADDRESSPACELGSKKDEFHAIQLTKTVKFISNWLPFIWFFIWPFFVKAELAITETRFEPMSAMSHASANKEGYFSVRAFLIEYWEPIYCGTKYSFRNNPYVWVIEFVRYA